MAKWKLCIADQYATDIISGKILACNETILACDRYFEDLKTNKEYTFNAIKAQAYIDFIQILSLTKGAWAGKPFILEPWQVFICWNIFGWENKKGKRRYTEATIHVPKKNGKTELAAAIAITCALLDAEYGGQIYMAATAREQASLCFETAKEMVKLTPAIQKYFKVSQHAVYVEKLASSIKAISSEASTAEGKGANCVIFDEEHEQKTNQLRNNLRSGMAAREQPLFISISTAGNDRNKPYYKHIDKCKKILQGVFSDPRHFIMIFTADPDDDWKQVNTWKKANPNYGKSLKSDFLKSEFQNVLNAPSEQPAFKTKHLNITSDTYNTWIAHEKWMAGKRDIKIEDYYGRECYAGLDLASRLDFTALALIFPEDDESLTLFMRFWIPKEMAKKRSEAAITNFIQWSNEAWIKLSDGDVTDYNFIQKEIEDLHNNFQLKSVAFDAHNSSQLVNNLIDFGVNMVEFAQGIMTMSTHTKEFEKLVLNGQLNHDGNPVMSWMLGNVLIYTDASLNQKIQRGKSTDKVDGPVAAVMAIGVKAETKKEEFFIY